MVERHALPAVLSLCSLAALLGATACRSRSAPADPGLPSASTSSAPPLRTATDASAAAVPPPAPQPAPGASLFATSDAVCVSSPRGDVSCWGRSDRGMLGAGEGEPCAQGARCFTRPTPVPGLGEVVQLALGDGHLCARSRDGVVRCQGTGYHGELGVTALGECVVPAFTHKKCALDTTKGELVCNGTETTPESRAPCLTTPTEVPALKGAKRLSLGPYQTCGHFDGGELRCAGSHLPKGAKEEDCSPAGSTSYPRDMCARTPQPIQGFPKDAHMVGFGHNHLCILTRDAKVSCEGTVTGGVTGAAELHVAGDRTCVLRKDGTVWCWGVDSAGNLGLGELPPDKDNVYRKSVSDPARVASLSQIKHVSAYGANTCAVRADGAVFCWGDNAAHQLGAATPGSSSTPVRVQGVADADQIAVGERFACAMDKRGAVFCWGSGRYGTLGKESVSESKCVLEYVAGNYPVPCSATPIRVL